MIKDDIHAVNMFIYAGMKYLDMPVFLDHYTNKQKNILIKSYEKGRIFANIMTSQPIPFDPLFKHKDHCIITQLREEFDNENNQE